MKKRLAIWSVLLVALALSTLLVDPRNRDAVQGAVTGERYSNGRPLRAWIDALADGDPELRREAIENLGDMGPEASRAIPALTRVAQKDLISVRSWAIYKGLGGIGPAALSALATLVKDRSVRSVAVVTIGNMGPRARPAVPILAEALKDEHWWTRSMAAAALGKVGSGARHAVPALTVCLNDQAPQVRCEAALALDRINPHVVDRTGLR
jgi:HEAT repeat protein